MSCDASALPAYPAVQAALTDIRTEHGVHIPLAVESGSRAWGFPSPDSDYDARFVYVRTTAQHLTPWPARDVIELPISGQLDVNGWDFAKALPLLLKGDAMVIEWLQSPLVYAVDPVFRAEMLAFADRFALRDAVARHDLHLGQRIEREFILGREEVKLKTLFYALRPAAALRWLRAHPDRAVAPMALPVLMAQSDAPAEVAEAVRALIARKAAAREMGSAPAPAGPVAFMQAVEWEAAEPPAATGEARAAAAARAEVEAAEAAARRVREEEAEADPAQAAQVLLRRAAGAALAGRLEGAMSLLKLAEGLGRSAGAASTPRAARREDTGAWRDPQDYPPEAELAARPAAVLRAEAGAQRAQVERMRDQIELRIQEIFADEDEARARAAERREAEGRAPGA